MAVTGAFLEAHSYSGGLRHTAYLDGAPRPTWAPSPDSVGWRDDFELDVGDVVVEFHQRAGSDGPVGWLAVYHRSVDARFGDRRNHAGMGVWLHGLRPADPAALLTALEQLSRALAKNPEPAAFASDVAAFSADRYLPRYLIAAERLPQDWRGVPASAGTLVDSAYFCAAGTTFDSAVGRVAEEVARCALDWSGRRRAPRTVILVTPKAAPPLDRTFEPLGAAGTFIADILERLPVAYDEERRTLRTEQASFEQDRAAWNAERQAREESWARERSEWQMLDRQPSSLEGIASRLNVVSAQLRDIEAAVRPVERQVRPSKQPTIPASPVPTIGRPAGERPARQGDTPDDDWHWALMAIPAIVLLVLAVLIWWFRRG